MHTTSALDVRRALSLILTSELGAAPRLVALTVLAAADGNGRARLTATNIGERIKYGRRAVMIAMQSLRDWIAVERDAGAVTYRLRSDGPLKAAFVPLGVRGTVDASKVEFRGGTCGELEPAAKALEAAFRSARRVKRLAPSAAQLPPEHREDCARWLAELAEDLGEELEPLASRVMFEWLRIPGQITPNWPLGFLRNTGWRLRDFPRDLARVATALRARRRPQPAAEPSIAGHILSAAEAAAAAQQALRVLGGAR